MKVTDEVMNDLLTLYVAGEASADTEALIESDAREVFHPRNVRLLRVFHGLHPGLADAMLRRVMGPSAAP